MNTPPALSEAEGKISRQLSTNPDDPEWLALKVRADLLDWNYESAMRSAFATVRRVRSFLSNGSTRAFLREKRGPMIMELPYFSAGWPRTWTTVALQPGHHP
jgi:hypothetical protein